MLKFIEPIYISPQDCRSFEQFEQQPVESKLSLLTGVLPLVCVQLALKSPAAVPILPVGSVLLTTVLLTDLRDNQFRDAIPFIGRYFYFKGNVHDF